MRRALAGREIGFYAIQAAIAAEHAEAPSIGRRRTGRGIVELYDLLMHADPSPVVALNRAAAIAERDGPAAGLALIDAILARGELGDYHPAHSARAELCRRLGRTADAAPPTTRRCRLRGRSRPGTSWKSAGGSSTSIHERGFGLFEQAALFGHCPIDPGRSRRAATGCDAWTASCFPDGMR